MLNTIEILIQVTLERKIKKIIAIDRSDDKEYKKRRMRKENKESIDETRQGLLIKQKNGKKIANCSSRNRTKKNT